MERKTIVIGVQTAVIVVLAVAAAVFYFNWQKDSKRPVRDSSIISVFDQADYERMETMVNRFHEGKGDNLMLVSITIEGGRIIEEAISDGRSIHWTTDTSRDAWSANKSKQEYECRAIEIVHKEDAKLVQLSKCQNYEADEVFVIAAFSKESRK